MKEIKKLRDVINQIREINIKLIRLIYNDYKYCRSEIRLRNLSLNH